jgi:SAM-dependent methyltransferase
MSDNAAQIEQWNGRTGDTWSRYAEVLDRVLAPLGEAAMERADLRIGQRVLDVGCGGGATTLVLAGRVGPTGHVLGVDVSAPLLARARERITLADPGAPVELREADAASAVLPSDRDRLFSRFGVMFFAEPARSFGNLRRALVADGRLAFVCWRKMADNPWASVGADAVATIVAPTPPVPFAPGPFAFADRTYVEKILVGAGYAGIDIVPYDATLRWTERADLDEAVDLFKHVGPAARAMADMNDDDRGRVMKALRVALAPHVGVDGLHLRAGVWLVSARNGDGQT